MGKTENLEKDRKTISSNNNKKRIQKESAGDLSNCLKETNIKDVIDWIDNSTISTKLKYNYPKIAEILKKSKNIDEYKNNLGYAISSVLFYIEAIEDCFISAEIGNHARDIENYIKIVKKGLKKIEKEKEHDLMYQYFVINETSNLKKLEWKFIERFGKKKRGKSST